MDAVSPVSVVIERLRRLPCTPQGGTMDTKVISQEELETLLRNGEADCVERTVSQTNTDKFAEAITAFSNDLPGYRKPGYLIIGANDDGSLSGLEVTDQLLQNLAALRSDGNIQPLPALTVCKVALAGGDVAVVEVQPSDLPPVRYKGRVYVRVGPRRAIANEHEERLLSEKRVSHALTFDARPCLDSRLDDLALELFRLNYLAQAVAPEVIEQNHRTIEEQLASLRFFDLRSNCPTHAGILLFGKNPLAWLPGAYVQFVSFDGLTLASDVLWERALSGDLFTVLKDATTFLELPVQSRPVSISLLQERNVINYPVEALRELAINAVLHRSYESTAPVRIYWFSDRIEIDNPGGLYGEASPENFPKRSSYRNPVLAEAMKVFGFVNRFGHGVAKARAALERNGNPTPAFEVKDRSFLSVAIRGIR